MIKFKIHVKMAEKRLSQKTVSEYIGVTPSVMGKYYHGTITRINPVHLDKLCELLECNTQDLIEYVPDKPLSK